MGGKLCPKVLLEGTRLTNKTEIAFALNEHPEFVGPRKYRYHSPIVSGEWCVFTNHPWGRGLINYNPDEEAKALEAYRAWINLLRNLPYYSWIIDRFHLATTCHQVLNHGRVADLSFVDEGLAELGFRLILCTRSEESFEDARRERLKVSGNPRQYDDLTPFIREQAMMRQLAAKSRMPVFECDVSGLTVPQAAQRITDYMKATGGLYQPDPA